MMGAMRVVIAPDSFKGSASAPEVAEAIAAGLRSVDDRLETMLLPMADGGEGTVAALTASLGGAPVVCTVPDPLDRPVAATYGWVAERHLAVIEMAAASGLPLLGDAPNPADASTLGTGALIRDALDHGAEHIILGIGGSATVDCGTGLLIALGARMLDREGRPVRGSGGTLGRIGSIDLSGLDPRLRRVRLTVATDVTSPLLGPGGAIHVFGPQKGVKDNEIDAFEAGMASFAAIVVATSGVDHRDSSGSGAAGVIAYLLRSALDTVEVREGFPLVAELADLRRHIAEADLVITGEGRLDTQSLVGKVPVSVARMARAAGVPAVAFAGSVIGDPEAFRAEGLAAALPIVDRPMSLAEAMAEAPSLITAAAARFMSALCLGRHAADRPDGPQGHTVSASPAST